MQDQDVAPTAPAVDGGQAVTELPAEELVVALYVSDWRSSERGLSLVQIERWATQGLARLGREQLWKAAFRMRKAGPAAAFPAKPLGPRRFQVCADLAWRYQYLRRNQGHPQPAAGSAVYVDVPAGDSTWSVPVSERDLECLTRWGSPWQPPSAA